ncbi:hypothetical protein CL645_02725 [bacterium]|nr:hypothetical protein [bacterium]|tara:strand:+ start:247 stop:927 length:681 start_codon:yes stop_codon:yes gene_type:complete
MINPISLFLNNFLTSGGLGGSIILLVIILLSIYGLAIVFERRKTFARIPKGGGKDVVRRIISSLEIDDIAEAKVQTSSRKDVYSRMLKTVLESRECSKAIFEENISKTFLKISSDLERNLASLATIVEFSPLIGLLGTIVGLMKIFGSISEGGLGHHEELAGGISTALITTAAGLIVAIFFGIILRSYKSKIEDISMNIENCVSDVVSHPSFFQKNINDDMESSNN